MEIEQELSNEYQRRFAKLADYRVKVWQVLTAEFFQGYLKPGATVLDLGCGWGEFINHIAAATKYGMDLNPDCPRHLAGDVRFLHQDCSKEWPLEEGTLDHVFTSNFFEHLPDKDSLSRTLAQAFRCLKPGGSILCLGPNIKFLPGLYWDFYDHYLPLTEKSLKEGLELRGFRVTECLDRFLPYTMVDKAPPPIGLLRLYLKLRPAWRFFGKQFLVIGAKPASPTA